MAALGGNQTLIVIQEGRAMYQWGKTQRGSIALNQPRRRTVARHFASTLERQHGGDWYFASTSTAQSHDDTKPTTWKAAACAFEHCCALSDQGQVFTWGSNSFGQLGHSEKTDVDVPTCISEAAFGKQGVTNVSSSGWHCAAVSEDGRLWTWGRGTFGQLGHHDQYDKSTPTVLPPHVFGRLRVVQASCGCIHTCCVTLDGSLWSWGAGHYGQLGLKDKEDRVTPTKLSRHAFNNLAIVVVCCGHSYTTAITEKGTLYTWGDGRCGALGHGDLRERLEPTVVDVTTLGGLQATWVSCGTDATTFTLVVTAQGSLFGCGSNSYGQLGLADTEDRQVFTEIPRGRFEGADVVHSACGHLHASAVTSQGRLFMWGHVDDARACSFPQIQEELLANTSLAYAQVGRSKGIPKDSVLAFAMATHHRLGRHSAAFGLVRELIQLVVAQAALPAARGKGRKVSSEADGDGARGKPPKPLGLYSVHGLRVMSWKPTHMAEVEKRGKEALCASLTLDSPPMQRAWPMGFGETFAAFDFLG